LERTPVSEIIMLSRTSLFWRRLSRDKGVWARKCEEEWRGKHVPQIFRAMLDAEPKAALRASLADAARTWLTEEELTGSEWCFRFKSAAGPSWLETDAFACGLPAVRCRFFKDGTVLRTGDIVDLTGIDLRWSFAPPSRPPEGRRHGSSVHISVNGRTVPTYAISRQCLHLRSARCAWRPLQLQHAMLRYVVSRHPKNWGFLMQSCWALFTSFPMPPKGEDPLLEDEHLAVTVEEQRALCCPSTADALIPCCR